jgi:hypothetical protein
VEALMQKKGHRPYDDRAEHLEFLLDKCRQFALEPYGCTAPMVMGPMLATSGLMPHEDDSPLVRALLKEANAHIDELAFRLEPPGRSASYVDAVIGRLCQTLTVLQFQLGRGSSDRCVVATDQQSTVPSP